MLPVLKPEYAGGMSNTTDIHVEQLVDRLRDAYRGKKYRLALRLLAQLYRAIAEKVRG